MRNSCSAVQTNGVGARKEGDLQQKLLIANQRERMGKGEI
jgi:hypothetical protein